MLATAAIALPMAAPSHAFELFGMRFFGRDAEDPELTADAQPYEIDFRVAGDDDDLEETLQNASQLYREREDVPLSPAALIGRARGDYARLVGALYGEGRYGPVIDITIDGRPAETIPADAQFGETARVVVTVDPGPQFRFGNVRIQGEPGPIPDDNDVPETPAELGLVPGNEARSSLVLQSEGVLVSRWRELGHPKAAIARRDAVARHESDTLDVGIDVDPGPFAVYGPVSVTGTQRMNPDFVARQTGIRPGEPFDPDDLELARKQLRRLEVFQALQIVEAEEVTPDGTLPLTVQVAERPLRVYGFGGTYSTLDGAGVQAYWQHRNLFGQAERLRVEGSVGRLGSNGYEDLEYRAGVTFVKPGVITPFTDLTARVLAEQERPESYLSRRAAAQIGLAHRFSDELSGNAMLNVERSRTEDPLGERDFFLVSLPSELTYDTRDDELNPTEGIRASLKAEPLYEFEFENVALITNARISTYYSIDAEDRFILAGRIGVGSIVGAARDELPADRLFFAGGGGSIRGYGYRNVGPRLPEGTFVNGVNVSNQVIGGRSYVDGSIELRAKVTDKIGVVAFADAGNAFLESYPSFEEDLKVGVGVGLRYFTALGPLRVDVALPLDPGPGDPDFGIYVGLGQAF
ncbi:autotransporter assembly complex protein TamA [Lutibaculum baratangense]|uniref:Outer membrane protein n=1 Tax=Lutibaculum baratangense AMV1 TaxID=631454 RepID=V4RB99_9HYPH|nr:autotransporter assembly complex family protein [Lutibaculum baratangense]ESR23411.1 Outer membrane protein [Lutibaculum baratangense AMV1]